MSKHITRPLKLHCTSNLNGTHAADLSQKIRSFESSYNQHLAANKPWILRLDGSSFKNYTSHFQKPFDKRFTDSLVGTSAYLLERTNARLAFCQSDEISLVFAATEAINPDPFSQNSRMAIPILFNGRCQKIASVMSGMASVKFNQLMQAADWSNASQQAVQKVFHELAFFDARAFSVPDEQAAMEAIYWRHQYDCRRNAIHMVAYHHLGAKAIHHKSLQEMTDMLVEQKGIDVAKDIDPVFLYGTFLKKHEFPHTGFDPRLGKPVETTRQKAQARVFMLPSMADDSGVIQAERINSLTRMVMAKTWNEVDSSKDGNPISEYELTME